MARPNVVGAHIVAVAWVRGTITNEMVHCITGKPVSNCGGRIQYEVSSGRLEKVPDCGYPGRWRLTAQCIEALVSQPDHDSRRALAEQVARRMDRVLEIRASTKPERMSRQRAALGSPVLAPKRSSRGGQMGPMRPPAPVGADLVARPLPSADASVTLDAGWRAAWLKQPVQDPQGLLKALPAAAASDPAFRLRGGLLAPADGPYIRPGARAADAVPSRRGDALVAHRPPLSQP